MRKRPGGWEVWHKDGHLPLSGGLSGFPEAEDTALNEEDYTNLMLRSPGGHWFAYNPEGGWAAQDEDEDAEREHRRSSGQAYQE